MIYLIRHIPEVYDSIGITAEAGVKLKYSDGATWTNTGNSSTSYTHKWDESATSQYQWVIAMVNGNKYLPAGPGYVTTLPSGSTTGYGYSTSPGAILWIVGDGKENTKVQGGYDGPYREQYQIRALEDFVMVKTHNSGALSCYFNINLEFVSMGITVDTNSRQIERFFDGCNLLKYVYSKITTPTTTNLQTFFGGCPLKICRMTFDITTTTSIQGMFSGAETSAENMPNFIYTGTPILNASSAFSSCNFITHEPHFLHGVKFSNVNKMFSGCHNLRYIDFLNLTGCTNTGYIFENCRALQKVSSPLDVSSSTSVRSMFAFCYSLLSIPDTLDISSATDANSMFMNCRLLTKVPSAMDFSHCTNVSNLFNLCVSLINVPDILDFSSVTSAANIYNVFINLLHLKAYPTHLSGPNGAFTYTISFAQSNAINDFDSLAKFDGSGNIIGGLAYYINDVTNASYTRTLTLHANTKNHFTEAEQTTIVAAFATKGWTLSW